MKDSYSEAVGVLPARFRQAAIVDDAPDPCKNSLDPLPDDLYFARGFLECYTNRAGMFLHRKHPCRRRLHRLATLWGRRPSNPYDASA